MPRGHNPAAVAAPARLPARPPSSCQAGQDGLVVFGFAHWQVRSFPASAVFFLTAGLSPCDARPTPQPAGVGDDSDVGYICMYALATIGQR